MVGFEYRGVVRAQFLDNPQSGGSVARQIRHLRKVVEGVIVGRILLN